MPCEFPAGYVGAAILERLAQVLDPEPEESILDLGFVAINSTKPRDGWRQQLAEAVLRP